MTSRCAPPPAAVSSSPYCRCSPSPRRRATGRRPRTPPPGGGTASPAPGRGGPGRRLAGERTTLGRVGIGVAVRADAPAVPEIGDIAALKRALEGVERVVFNRASTGLYLERLFERMGLTAAIAPKAVRTATGAEVMRHLAEGTGREIGLGPITEVLMEPGVRLVGPLPAEAQNHTAYAASLMPGAAPAAAALLEFLAGPEGRAAFARAGIEPVP